MVGQWHTMVKKNLYEGSLFQLKEDNDNFEFSTPIYFFHLTTKWKTSYSEIFDLAYHMCIMVKNFDELIFKLVEWSSVQTLHVKSIL